MSNIKNLVIAAGKHPGVWTSDFWPETFVNEMVSAVAAECVDAFSKSLPSSEERQWLWVQRALLSSTKGLARPGLATEAAHEVFKIIKTARDHSVSEHLWELYRFLDHRGSDVRLDEGEVLDSAAQAVPYPAPIWKWHTVPQGLSGFC